MASCVRTCLRFRGRTNSEVFFPEFTESDWSDIDVLAYAQHHGAPTRLLDWSRNPLIALWFAVSDKRWDAVNGVVFQLGLPQGNSLCFGRACDHLLNHIDNCSRPIHVFASPHRIDRSERQRGMFSVSTFTDGNVLKPLDRMPDAENFLRKFPINAFLKPGLRRLLLLVGLDAYSVYGDPDSYGRSLALRLDMSDFAFPHPIPQTGWLFTPGDPPSKPA